MAYLNYFSKSPHTSYMVHIIVWNVLILKVQNGVNTDGLVDILNTSRGEEFDKDIYVFFFFLIIDPTHFKFKDARTHCCLL